MQQQISTYIKGMNQDTSFLKTDNTSAYEIRNFKVITDDGGSTGALVNEKGMKYDFCLPSLEATYQITDFVAAAGVTITLNTVPYVLTGTTPLEVYNELTTAFSTYITQGLFNFYYSTEKVVLIIFDPAVTITVSDSSIISEMTSYMETLYIVGWTHLNDKIIILSTANDGNGQIWEVSYDEVTNTIDVDSNGCLKPKDTLRYNGCINLHTDNAVTKIEARYETQKIAHIYWTDNNEPVKSFNLNDLHGFALDCNSFNLTPSVKLSQPNITDITSTGNIPYGASIQMGYRLKNSSSLSNVSPLTPILQLYEKDDEGDDYKDIKGSPANSGTGKAISFTIDNLDTTYDIVEYVFLIYTTINLPEIVSFSESIPTSGSVSGSFSNLEVDLITLTPQEINLDTSDFNIAKDIVVKHNRLIAANLKLNEFDVTNSDFDARAYRYDSTGVSTIFESSGTSTVVPADFNILDTHDAINPFNNPLDSNYALYNEQKYQSDGITLGGTGKNISYKFITKTLRGDDKWESNSLPWTGPSHRESFEYSPGNNTVTYNISNQFNNFTSPFIAQHFTGYQRDEVYRFGIVFYSKTGQRSFAKWIGDIKFPDNCENLITTGTDISLTAANPNIDLFSLGIEFTINIPSGLENVIQGYEILRLDRGVNDITRWGGGITTRLVEDVLNSNNLKPNYSSAMVFETDLLAPRVLRTIFPFSLFRDYTGFAYKNGDYIKINYGYPSSTHHLIYHNEVVSGGRLYYEKLFSPHCYSVPNETTILGMKGVLHGGVLNIQQIDNSVSYGDFVNQTDDLVSGVAKDCARCDIMVLQNTFPIENIDSNFYQLPYMSYCRNLTKQYGGNTYESRSSDVYISTGVVTFTTNNEVLSVYGGDSYVHYFLYENVSSVATEPSYVNKASSAVGFPCESPFNADLRRGNFFQKDRGVPTGTNDSSDPFVSYGVPQYASTEVYEQQNNTKLFVDKNFQTSFNTEFPYTIWASELKLNGELVDSWGTFLTNNKVDVEGSYGEITSIHNFKDKILFYQNQAFGALAVNERSVITDANGVDLVLGKGDVVGQFVYISKHTGCSHRTGVIQSENNIYHFDVRQKKLWQYGINSKLPLSDMKGLSAFFDKLVSNTNLEANDAPTSLDVIHNIHGAYEHRYNRVFFTFLTDKVEETISFNELLNSFESFYDFTPKMYLSTGRKLLSIDRTDNNKVYQHDKGDYCVYYDNAPVNSVIDVVINGGSPLNKVWHNIQWLSELTNSSADIQGTYETITITNDYQSTGAVTLIEPDNIRRRFRAWRHAIQRDINTSGAEPRIRNPWVRIKLEKSNDNNYKFISHDLITTFGLSTITKLNSQK